LKAKQANKSASTILVHPVQLSIQSVSKNTTNKAFFCHVCSKIHAAQPQISHQTCV